MTGQNRRGGIGRWLLPSFAMLGWTAALVAAGGVWWLWQAQTDYYDTTGGVYETFYAGDPHVDQRIAIIDIEGVIVEGYDLEQVVERVADDERVVAVVVRIESPGGTVTGSDYIFHHLKELRQKRQLPMVVSMGSIAASGGYYAAMAVGDEPDRIFAEPASITGSIGVILPHYDVSGLMERYEVQDDSIKSHPNKQMLAMTRRMTPEQRERLQIFVDEMFRRFKEVVQEGRPRLAHTDDGEVHLRSLADRSDLATGEVFNAPTALEHGLIDRLGYLEDAVERAAELAGYESSEAVRVVRYQRPRPLIELPTFIETSEEATLARWLSQPHAPRAWYFAGSPPLMPY